MKRITNTLKFVIIVTALVIGGLLYSKYKTEPLKTQELDRKIIAADYDAAKDTDKWEGKTRARLLAREHLKEPYQSLKKIHHVKTVPKQGDWLAQHKESGQSLKEYISKKPVRKSDKLTTIYIQRIGPFSKDQAKIIDLSAEFLAIFFDSKVKEIAPLDLDKIPDSARRKFPHGEQEQLLTSYIRNKVLLPNRPKDALATVGFSSVDLWPGKGWNFVYGQASIRERTGIWSIYRFGNPSDSKEAFKKCLMNTIKTAAHETVHILSIRHCITYKCLINGVNGPHEKATLPLALCPICVNKICWNIKADPAKRYQKLIKFCEANGLKEEAAFYKKSLEQIKNVK